MGLTNRQRVFVDEYLQCWNGSEAARRAGYTGRANTIASRLLSNVDILALIKQRLDESAMSSGEVLQRLTQHARGDMGDFLDIESMSFDVDLFKAKEKNLTRLIHKVKQRTITTIKGDEETETNIVEIELYDAQNALIQLAKHHGLIIDRSDITSKGEKLAAGVLEIIPIDYRTAIANLAPRPMDDSATPSEGESAINGAEVG